MPKRLRRRLEHAQALGHHFLADAVAGDRGDPEKVGFIRLSLWPVPGRGDSIGGTDSVLRALPHE